MELEHDRYANAPHRGVGGERIVNARAAAITTAATEGKPERQLWRSFALNLISVPVSAFETGQPTFVFAACS